MKSDPSKRPNCDRIDSYFTDLSEIIAEKHNELQLLPLPTATNTDDSTSIMASSTYF